MQNMYFVFQHLHPYNPYINVHSQLYFSHLQLVVILGLTKDEGNSFLGRLCRSKLVQILGEYSMATYMLHDDVQKIIIFHAQLPQVSFLHAMSSQEPNIIPWLQESVITQMCCIFLTFLLSFLVTHLVEKPIYKVSSALLFKSQELE